MKKPNKIIFPLLAMIMLAATSGVAVGKGKVLQNNTEESSNKPQKQWYMSTSLSVFDEAKARIYDSANPAIFGKLVESNKGHDKHDIRPFSSLARSRAAIIFHQEDWGDQSGEYLSDYHDINGQSDSWVFTVISSVDYGEITLNWDGLFALTSVDEGGRVTYEEEKTLNSRTLNDLHLIDLDTLQVVDAVTDGKLNNYTFNMRGESTSRNFRWVLGPINASYFKPASGAMKYIKAQQKELDRQAAETAKTSGAHGKIRSSSVLIAEDNRAA